MEVAEAIGNVRRGIERLGKSVDDIEVLGLIIIIIIIMNFYSPVSNTRCHSIGHKMRIARIKIRVDSQGRWERAYREGTQFWRGVLSLERNIGREDEFRVSGGSEFQTCSRFTSWMGGIEGCMHGGTSYMGKHLTLAQRERNGRFQNKWWWWWRWEEVIPLPWHIKHMQSVS